MKTGKILIGIMAGVAAGAALGVLYAPRKGRKTRKKMFRKGHDAMDELRDKYDNLLDTVTDKLRMAKAEGNHLLYNRDSKAGKTVEN